MKYLWYTIVFLFIIHFSLLGIMAVYDYEYYLDRQRQIKMQKRRWIEESFLCPRCKVHRLAQGATRCSKCKADIDTKQD